MANGNFGPPKGADSDHIAAERARLKQASVKHFAQTKGGSASAILGQGGLGGPPKSPPKRPPPPPQQPPMPPPTGGAPDEDGM